MIILALDLAKATGWAVTNTDCDIKLLSSGTEVFEYDTLEERLCTFSLWLTTILNEHTPEVVIYERAHFVGGPATRSALGYETIVRMECWWGGFPAVPVHSNTLKLFATGNGKATKSEMVAAGMTIKGGAVADDNEADAICLAWYGRENVWIDSKGKAKVRKRVNEKARRGKKKKEKA